MKIKKPDNKTIHIIILLAIFIILKSLSRHWYEFLLIYFAYFVVMFFIFLGTSIGNMGYFIQIVLHNQRLANKFYEMALKLNTKSNYALTAYGLDLLKNGNPARALELFKRNLELKSTKPIFIKYSEMNMASCYWKLGNVKKSIEILEMMYEKYEYFNADFYTTLGYMYLLDNQIDKALEYTKKALKDNKEHGPAYDNMGQIYFRLEDYDLAGRYFRKGLKLKDTMADSKFYLGLIHEQKGDIDKAKEYFKMAHESNINGLNTVTREEVDKKYNEYF